MNIASSPTRLSIEKWTLARVALLAVLASGCLTQRAATQARPDWIVLSGREQDERIARQMQALAANSGAELRWLESPLPTARSRQKPGDMLIELNVARNASVFLAQLGHEARGSKVKPTAELAKEGYILRCFYSRASRSDRAQANKVRIEASSAAGLHNAILRIPDILASNPAKLADFIPSPQSVRLRRRQATVVIADYPSFPIRGVVEGFYGPPWSHSDRLELLRFEGQHSLNIYIYGPKDDPYHRKLWREPYPPEQLQRLKELAETAKDNFVDFSFAISPGLSMIYSSEADFQALVRKLEAVAALGVSNFALFLDDVPQDLVHREDKARFGTLAEAHIQLINRLHDHLKSLSPQNRLTVCPTTYTNEWGNRDYIQALGKGVNPAVPLDWTGTQTIPRGISVAEAEEWSHYLRRKPLVWDNYPVNDDNPWWLNLGPLRQRDTGLFRGTQGLFSNPMIQPHLTRIPLQTVSDYLWNPPAYNPDKSRRHALLTQYGEDAHDLLAPLLTIFSSDQGAREVFRPIFEESWNPIDVAAVELQISRLLTLATALRGDKRFEGVVPEISSVADLLRNRLARVQADAMFARMEDGKIKWDPFRDELKAFRVPNQPVLDGDFSKWESGPIYRLNEDAQIVEGKTFWPGASQFSVRVALAWDEENLYVGTDVTDPALYQPFMGRGVENADALRLVFDTVQPQSGPGKPLDTYDLYLSPGDFAGVKPSIYCEEDYLPPRPQRHDYNTEIRMVWKKTPRGFSGDVAIPVSFFTAQTFAAGQQIGLSFGAQKAATPESPEAEPRLIIFSSKNDMLFPVDAGNPATLQRLLLVQPPSQH